MSGVQTISVEEGESGGRLDRWFKRRFPHLTHGQLEKLLRTGQIRVDGARAKSATRLETGQEIRVPPLPDPADAPARGTLRDTDIAFARSLVLYEDDWVIALNKPSGLATQGGTKTKRHVDGLLAAFADEDGERPRLVHRLDRDTSGVLLVGKTPASAAALARAFATRGAEKTYWALSIGVPVPAAGLIKGFMRKAASASRGGDREMMVSARHGEEGAVYARTRFAVVAAAGRRAAWVALRPETGRTHQLRFHMAMMGTAILGDRKYTCEREVPQGLPEGLMLHARAVSLPHPSRRGTLRVEAPPPPHMREAFDLLGWRPDDYADPFEAL